MPPLASCGKSSAASGKLPALKDRHTIPPIQRVHQVARMLGIQEDKRGLGGNCQNVKQVARFSDSEEKKQVVENNG